MNSEQIAEYNLACAKYMWPESDIGLMNGKVWGEDSNGLIVSGFNPYHDANDRNKVLEKMKVNTTWNDDTSLWWCDFNAVYISDPHYSDSSMEAAQIACIASVLGVNQ